LTKKIQTKIANIDIFLKEFTDFINTNLSILYENENAKENDSLTNKKAISNLIYKLMNLCVIIDSTANFNFLNTNFNINEVTTFYEFMEANKNGKIKEFLTENDLQNLKKSSTSSASKDVIIVIRESFVVQLVSDIRKNNIDKVFDAIVNEIEQNKDKYMKKIVVAAPVVNNVSKITTIDNTKEDEKTVDRLKLDIETMLTENTLENTDYGKYIKYYLNSLPSDNDLTQLLTGITSINGKITENNYYTLRTNFNSMEISIKSYLKNLKIQISNVKEVNKLRPEFLRNASITDYIFYSSGKINKKIRAVEYTINSLTNFYKQQINFASNDEKQYFIRKNPDSNTYTNKNRVEFYENMYADEMFSIKKKEDLSEAELSMVTVDKGHIIKALKVYLQKSDDPILQLIQKTQIDSANKIKPKIITKLKIDEQKSSINSKKSVIQDHLKTIEQSIANLPSDQDNTKLKQREKELTDRIQKLDNDLTNIETQKQEQEAALLVESEKFEAERGNNVEEIQKLLDSYIKCGTHDKLTGSLKRCFVETTRNDEIEIERCKKKTEKEILHFLRTNNLENIFKSYEEFTILLKILDNLKHIKNAIKIESWMNSRPFQLYNSDGIIRNSIVRFLRIQNESELCTIKKKKETIQKTLDINVRILEKEKIKKTNCCKSSEKVIDDYLKRRKIELDAKAALAKAELERQAAIQKQQEDERKANTFSVIRLKDDTDPQNVYLSVINELNSKLVNKMRVNCQNKFCNVESEEDGKPVVNTTPASNPVVNATPAVNPSIVNSTGADNSTVNTTPAAEPLVNATPEVNPIVLNSTGADTSLVNATSVGNPIVNVTPLEKTQGADTSLVNTDGNSAGGGKYKQTKKRQKKTKFKKKTKLKKKTMKTLHSKYNMRKTKVANQRKQH
jgi:hypothetical protein